MKYIIVKGMPIIFSEGLVHKEIAGNIPVDNAGFVNIYPVFKEDGESFMECKTHGKSFSLQIKSNPPIDNEIIKWNINNHE